MPYLDPGTANLILQSFIGIVAAIAAGIGVFWARIRSWFSPRSGQDNQQKHDET